MNTDWSNWSKEVVQLSNWAWFLVKGFIPFVLSITDVFLRDFWEIAKKIDVDKGKVIPRIQGIGSDSFLT